MKFGVFLMAVLMLGGCAAEEPKIFTAKGLWTGCPGINAYSKAAPGESVILARPHKNAPPLIPHDISDLKISRDSNDCLACHLDGDVKIPDSHFVNPYTKERSKDTPTGTRYNCLQCHAPQSADVPPVTSG